MPMKSDEVKARKARRITTKAARAGVEFLKALPSDVDCFSVLTTLNDSIGDEIATEILRQLLGVEDSDETCTYEVVPIKNKVVIEQKINAIKTVRQWSGVGLREAKDFVEGTSTMKLNETVASSMEHELCEFGFELREIL